MKNLIQNLDRKKVLLILEWCKTNFGRSKYHRKYPRLRVYRSTGKSSFQGCDGALCGTYRSGVISIYLGSHNSMKEVCRTVIHEYKHYLMSIREYRSIATQFRKKGYSENNISFNHPHEKECRSFENDNDDLCFSQLRKKLYSKI